MQPLDRWYHCCEPSPSDGSLFLHGGLTTELQVSKQETEEASGGSGWYYKTSGLMNGVISGKEATVPLSSRHLAHNSSASSTLSSNPPSLTSKANLDSSTARKPIVLSDLWVLSPATDKWERIDASVEGFAEENNHSNQQTGAASTTPATPTRRRRSFLSASSAKTKDAAAARIVASNLARNNPSSLARYNHTVTHLEDGRLVIIGGMDAGHSLQDTVWVADSTLRPVRFSRQRIDTEGNTGPVAGKGGSSPTQRRPSTAASHLPPNLLRRKAHSCASVHHGRLLVVVGGEGTNGALKRDCIVLSTTDSPSAAWSVVFYAQALLPQAMGQFVLSPLLNTADTFDCWSTIEIETTFREGTRPEEGHFAPFESAWRRRNIDNSKVAADIRNKPSMYPSIGGGEEGCVSLFCVSGHPAAYSAGHRASAPSKQLKAEHEGGGKSPSTDPLQNAKEKQSELLTTSGQTQPTPKDTVGQSLVKSSDRFMSLSVLSIISRYIPSLQKWTVGVTACPVPVSSPSGPCPRHAHAAIVCDGSDALWKGSWLADEDRPTSSSTTNSDESENDDADEEPNHQQLAANVVAETRRRLRSLEGLWRAAMEQGRMESNAIFKAIAEAQLTLVISGGRRSRIVNNQRSVQLVNANPHNHTASNLRRPSTAATLEASLSVRLLPGTLSDWWVFSFASGRWRLITDDVHPLGVAMVSQHATINKASSLYPFEYQYSAKSLLEDTPTSARRCGHTMQLLQLSRAAHRLMCQKRRRAAILSEKQRQRGPLSNDGLRGLHSTGLGSWDDGDGATTSSGAVDYLMTDQNAVLLSEPFYPPVRLVVFGGIDPAITQQSASIDASRGSSALNTNASTTFHTSATTVNGTTTHQQSQFAAAKSSKSLASYSYAVVDGEGFIHRFGHFDDVEEEEGSDVKATKKRSKVTVTSPKPSADPIVPVAADLLTPIQHFTSHQFGLVVERGIWGGMMPAFEGGHQHPPPSPSGLAQGPPPLPPSPMYFGGPFTDDAVGSTSIQRLRNRPLLLAEGSQSVKTLATMVLEAEQLIIPVSASNKRNSRFVEASLTQSGKRHHQIGREVEEGEPEALSPSMLLNAVRERERKMRELQMTSSSVSTRPATVFERLDIVSSEPTDTRAHGLPGDELPFQNLALNEACSPQMPLDAVVALLITHNDLQVESSKIEGDKELFPAHSEDIINSNVGPKRFTRELYSHHVDGLRPHSSLNNTYLLPPHVAAKVTAPHPNGSPHTLFPMIKSVATSIAKIDDGYPTDNAGLTVFATYAGRGVSRAAEATTGCESIQLSPLRALSGTPNKQKSTTGVFSLKIAKPTTSLQKRK